MFLYYVYAYSMRAHETTGRWPQLNPTAIISYHEDVLHADHCMWNMINNDLLNVGVDECWGIGAIPLCHDEHCLA